MDRAGAILESEFTCSICLEILEDPKSLLCGHNFCGRCLKEYLIKEDQKCPGLQRVRCPQCREETPLPDPSRPVSDWFKQFRTNWGIRNAIEGLTDQSRKDCDVCRDEGIEVESDHVCKTCALAMCRRCFQVHQKIPSCRHHEVSQTKSSQRQVFKRYDFKVRLITSSSSKQRNQQALRLKRELKHRIENICKRAADSVKEKELQLSKQADDLVDEMFQRFNANHPFSECLEHQAEGGASQMDPGQRFLTVICLTSKVESLVTSKCSDSIANLQVQLEFRDEENTSVKEIAESLSLGADDNVDYDNEEVTISPQDEVEFEDSSSSEEEEDFVPEYVSTIQSMTDDDDNDPWIRNIIIMTSCDMETVVVTDYNNACVKSFFKDDDTPTPQPYDSSRLVLGGKPWGLTQLPNERIAVSLPDERMIHIIRVKPQLKKLSEIKVGKKIYGIAALDSATLIVSAANDRSPGLYIIDFNGRTLKTIAKDTRGRDLFERPFHIVLSESGDIIVAEEKSKKILFVTKEGYLRARDKSKESYRPRTLYGIACDTEDNVFIVDREAGKIVWIRDGKDDKVFLSEDDGIFFPRCIGIYKDESMFVVEEGGAIKKFSLVDP